MIIIACIDERGALMFNHRRVARDRYVTRDIMEHCDGQILRMNAYSYQMFSEVLHLDPEAVVNPDIEVIEGYDGKNIIVSEHFLDEAKENEYCFVEDKEVIPYEEKIEKIIIYRWDERYPKEFCLDIALVENDNGWYKEEETEFVGYSHKKITKEVYTR